MSYTRKPKSLHPYLVQLSAGQAHTWQSTQNTSSLSNAAVNTEGLSLSQRTSRDRSRKEVGRYLDSRIANSAIQHRRHIAHFTKQDRERIVERMDRAAGIDKTADQAKPTLTQRPIPDATLYRRSPF